MKTRALAFLVLAGALPGWAASDDYRDGRIRLAEPGVTLQRVDEPSAEEALSNMPFLPGDRVWTDFSGRAEFQFADGSVARLDTRSKLDYLAHDDGRGGDLVVLSLWSGGLYLHVRDGRQRADFQIETPEGLVDVREAGLYRVDVERGELRLSVYDGQATLESGRRDVSVRRGERAWTRRGYAPGESEPFDERDEDDFARWDRERGDPWAWAGDSRRYLPDEVSVYADDFDRHGAWHLDVEIGYVWRPHVAVGWAPYVDGRWVWTAWGWTWVPYESWGWAPFHYGRWGHSAVYGWYWIPGRAWGPAWVTWAVSDHYVGWCPLGWRDRPVVVPHRFRGHAVPRGGHDGLVGSSAWVYAHRERMGTRDVAVRRADLGADVARTLRPVDVGHGRLTRELQVVDAGSPQAPRGAVARGIRVRPSPADTVPELRGGDGRTTIPDPAVRRRPTDRDRPRYDRDAAAGADDATARVRTPRRSDPAQRDDAPAERPTRRFTPDRLPPEWRQVPGDDDGARTRPVRPPEIAPPAGDAGRDTDRGATRRDTWRERERDDGKDGKDSEVLRRFFQPLVGTRERERDDNDGRDTTRTRPRDGDDGSATRVRPHDRGDDRPSWQPRDDGAARRAPERSQPQVERRGSSSTREGGRGASGAREGGATRRQPPPKQRDQ